jgi:hypothetical protein
LCGLPKDAVAKNRHLAQVLAGIDIALGRAR